MDGRNTRFYQLPVQWGMILNYNNATQTHSIFVKPQENTFQGKSMVNFYIANALGQNLANSESCPILRLL